MADDLIDEWRRQQAAPPRSEPPRGAAPAADDLISEWRKTLPPPKPEVAARRESGDPDADRMARRDWLNEFVGESHGHGTPTLTDLVTGKRPDSSLDVLSRAAGGVGAGARDVAGTIAQGIAYLGDKGAGALSDAGLVSPETAHGVSDWRTAVNNRIAAVQHGFEDANPGTAGELGRIGGQVAATGPILGAGGAALRAMPGAATVGPLAGRASSLPIVGPLLPHAVRGAATGAGINALTSSATDDSLGDQAKWGAIGGAALGPLGHGLGRLVGGAVDRETANLAQLARNYGIPLRIDQISANPMVRFGGSVMQRAPGTGLAANVAEQQGSFNRAVANTFGENADKITPDVMAAAKSRIGNTFETTLPRLEAYLNPKVAARLQNIADHTDYLPPDEAKIVNKHIDDILRQFTGVGSKSSRMAPKAAARADGKEIQALIASGSPLDRAIQGGSSNVKHFAGQLKDLLLDSVGQTPTGRAKTAAAYVQKLQDFQQARFQYKNMKTVEDLAEKATTGDVSPALLMGQVRKSFGNMAYGGGGDLANLARIGQRFLKEPPSSGTAERLAMMKLGAGVAVGGGGLVATLDPEHFQRDAAMLGAALLAARTGGAALKAGSNPSGLVSRLGISPVAAAIRSGLRGSPPSLGPALSAGLPAFAPRHNPLQITVHPAPAQQ